MEAVVLIVGESGTGKSLLASSVSDGPEITLNEGAELRLLATTGR